MSENLGTVVVELKGKKNVFHYVARVDDTVSEDWEISVTYLQTKASKYDQELFTFSLPDKATSYQVPVEDVIKILPVPITTGGTKPCQQPNNISHLTVKLQFSLNWKNIIKN